MATKWNDLKHKSSPKELEQLKWKAGAELDTLERNRSVTLAPGPRS